jgi:hypothetical protein
MCTSFRFVFLAFGIPQVLIIRIEHINRVSIDYKKCLKIIKMTDDMSSDDERIDYVYYKLCVKTVNGTELVMYVSNEVSDGEIMAEICTAFHYFPVLNYIGFLGAPHWNNIQSLTLEEVPKSQWETYYIMFSSLNLSVKAYLLNLFKDLVSLLPERVKKEGFPDAKLYNLNYTKTPVPANGLPEDVWTEPPELVAAAARYDAKYKAYLDRHGGVLTLPVYVMSRTGK